MTKGYEEILKNCLDFATTYSKRNFILDYINLLQSVSDAPVEFHLIASLFVLSTLTAQRFVFASAVDSPLFSTDKEGIQGRKLNLFIIIFGKSRISRKTSAVMKKLDEILKELNINQVSDVWSTPHLITQLSKKISNNSVHAVWLLDECSLFFDLISKSNSYLADAEAALSKLYDGITYSAGTEARGSEYVPNPHFSVFLASTESLPAKFKENAFEQGFYNRFIFVPARRRERKDLKTTLTDEQKRKAFEILEYFKAIRKLNRATTLLMSDEARKIYQEFEAKIEKKIEKDDLNFKEGYYGGVPQNVIRIACLLRINRLGKDELEKESFESILEIEKKDMELAVKIGDLILLWFERMIDLRIEHSKKPKKVGTVEDAQAIILAVYKKLGKRDLAQNVIRKKSKLYSNDMLEALETIAEKHVGEQTGGRLAEMWRLNEDVVL